MPIYRFVEVKQSFTKSGACPVCGKKVRRSLTFSETLNPFNKNADGTPKTQRDILVSIAKNADEWMPDFTHWSCEEAAS
jgi:hypothetical protein